MSSNVELYDTTLRDGTQMEGISLSVKDKLKIAARLDELGVHYIEGGYPGSNPKDIEFFERAKTELTLKKAKLAAFGSTRKAGGTPDGDPNLKALLEAETPVVTIVGKASDKQVTHILETTLEENLAMLADSVRYLKSQGRKVFLDAEHFFDGYESDPRYALQCLKTVANAGADAVVLCDTNGGMVTSRVSEIVRHVVGEVSCAVGMHAHNGADVAVANSLAAVEAGATHVQGAANGYGDMCGNANMFSIIANLKLKLGLDVISGEELLKLTETALFISEVANMPPNPRQPYVGAGAFSHKAGLHVAGVVKEPWSYQHVDPAAVGNDTRILVSELAGRRNITAKMAEQGIDIELSDQEARDLVERVKVMESRGYVYEGAEASFELLVRRSRPGYKAPFELVDFWVVERRHHEPGHQGRELQSEAMVKVRLGENGDIIHTAADGNGPVNALDAAVRRALVQHYPAIGSIHLVDYKVRIIDSAAGTGAAVRVLIESADGDHNWTTVGASTDVIEASWLALSDSLEYWIYKYGSAAG